MRILCRELYTPKWLACRKGVLTAGHIGDILAAEGTQRQRNYIDRLILDLREVPDHTDEYADPWFIKARRVHERALALFTAEQSGILDIEPCGFAVHDNMQYFGCTTYGLVRNTVLSIHYRYALAGFTRHTEKISPGDRDRAQAMMLVTGRPYCTVLNYWQGNGEERLSHHHVDRDPARIEYMTEEIIRFRGLLLRHLI